MVLIEERKYEKNYDENDIDFVRGCPSRSLYLYMLSLPATCMAVYVMYICVLSCKCGSLGVYIIE
jgi:hypothetical protein